MSLSNKLSITDVDLKDKRVLIRVSDSSSPYSTQQIQVNLTDTILYKG